MKSYMVILSLLMVTPAIAAEKTLRLDDAGLILQAAIGKQITMVFSPALTPKYFPDPAYPNVSLANFTDKDICFYDDAIAVDQLELRSKELSRNENGELCVARGDVSARYDDVAVPGAAPTPFFQADPVNCKWEWVKGVAISLWAEKCIFESGTLSVSYDEKTTQFLQNVTDAEGHPVIWQFTRKAGDELDALLPELRSKNLIPNDDECKFQLREPAENYGAWTVYDIMPTGKRKVAFDAAPQDEIPEPPCGQLGLAVDYVGYFVVNKDHADRVLFLDLGQDVPLFDPYSITFN